MTRSLQKRVYAWAAHAFPGIIDDKMDRAWRVLEEATELAQACGIPQAKAHEQVRRKYDGDPGEVRQEIAGVINSVLICAEAYGVDAVEAGEDELQRAWEKIELIRQKNLTVKVPVHGPATYGGDLDTLLYDYRRAVELDARGSYGLDACLTKAKAVRTAEAALRAYMGG